MIEEHHECIACFGRQYNTLLADLDAANDRDQRDNELLDEIVRRVNQQRNP